MDTIRALLLIVEELTRYDNIPVRVSFLVEEPEERFRIKFKRRQICTYLEIDFGMWIKGVIDRVERDVEVRQAVEDPSELRYRVLFGKLLTARHFGEPLSAENPVEELLLLVKTCYDSCNTKESTG